MKGPGFSVESDRNRAAVGTARVLGVSVVMLVAANWRSTWWFAWAAIALGVVAFDAARAGERQRALAPAATGAAACVLWNAWRYGAPPLRVFGFACAAGLLAAIVRGRALTR